MSNYSKNLQGENSKLFVSPAIAYTTDASIRLFLANAPSGEIGVYLEDGTLQTGALAAGDVFKIVQMRDGVINATPLIKFDSIVRSAYIDYVAPVRQVSYIGCEAAITGTSDLSFNFTGASVTNALTAGISVRDTSPGNMPFPVQEGYATITSTTQDEYTTLAQIVSDLNGDFDYERTQPDRFVKAEIVSNGALTGLGQTAAVVNGSVNVTAGAAVTLSDGTLLSLAGVIYQVNGAVSSSTAIVLDRPYQGSTATLASGTTTSTAATSAYTSGTTKLGVKLTSLYDESHFKVVGVDNLYLSPVTYSTAWKLGTGSYAMISEWENRQAAIWDGVGSTINAAFASDYGQPTKLASSSLTYDLLILEMAPEVFPAAALPTYKQTQIEKIAIAIPSSGTTPETDLKTIFGL